MKISARDKKHRTRCFCPLPVFYPYVLFLLYIVFPGTAYTLLPTCSRARDSSSESRPSDRHQPGAVRGLVLARYRLIGPNYFVRVSVSIKPVYQQKLTESCLAGDEPGACGTFECATLFDRQHTVMVAAIISAASERTTPPMVNATA